MLDMQAYEALIGSVENLGEQPEDHEVVCEDFQGHFADLRPVRARTNAAIKITLQHAYDRFDLTSLAVGG